jgi:hypothetical protein
MAASRFTITTFLVTGGLLIWSLDFTFAYTFVALACARGFAHSRVLGLPLLPVTIAISSVVSLAGVVALTLLGLRTLRSERSAWVAAPFLERVAVVCSVLAGVAILWTGMVAGLPPPRC